MPSQSYRVLPLCLGNKITQILTTQPARKPERNQQQGRQHAQRVWRRRPGRRARR